MRTTTLRLGTAVIVPPWHNPVLLAEEAATLDLLSRGRLDLGIGKGYRHSEFKGFQIAPEEAEARFEEAVEVMTRAWTTRERFSHKGRFWHFEDIVVEPPPAQRPHPPLWVAAGNPHSIRRAAARGFNLILDQYASPATLGERIAIYRAEREASSGVFDPMQVTVARQLYVAKDRADKEAALVRQAEYTRRTINVSRDPVGKSRIARTGLCRQSGRHGRECALRHARRNCAHDRSAARCRRILCAAHDCRRCGPAAPFRPRNHAGLRSGADRAGGGMNVFA